MCTDVGVNFPEERRKERFQALARVLYDDGADAGPATRRRVRGMLLTLSMGD